MKKLNLQNIKRLSFSLLTIVYFSGILNAQNLPKLKDPQNPLIVEHAFMLDSDGGLIYWNEGALNINSLFTTHRNNTGLGDLDSMAEISTWRDSLLEDEDSPAPDLFHTLYQQYYHGVKVEGAEYTLHHDGEEIWISSGFIAENLNLSVSPQINESTALNYALQHVGAETWLWDSVETEYPIGELVITFIADSNGNESWKLAWKFTIVALSELYNSIIYIDANYGSVIRELNNIRENNNNGEFNHIHYGTKNDLDTRFHDRVWPASDGWRLFADGNTRNIYTSDHSRYHGSDYHRKNWGWTDMPFSAGDDVWGWDNWSATAAHYCAQKSWDYFKQTPLNRNGITGWGKHIRIIADYPFSNAAYDGNTGEDYLLIGRFNNNYLGTYDIIGHEFTHGVTNRSKYLPYEKISGALDESFADIFGYMIERYAMGGHQNWTIGEHANTTLRDMQNPNSYSDPRFFLQSPFWINVSGCVPSGWNDYCGVHTNSGVQNKWFQLLTTGGTNNINGNNRSVGGIGADKAARIAYYTLVNFKNYDFQNSNFNVVRANSIASAVILYGMCSNEYNNTCAAWHAVNVGNLCNPCALAWRNSRFENSVTGTKNKSKTVFNVSLYPNPTNSKITLLVEESRLNENDHYQIDIYDIQGKLLLSQTTSNVNNYEIDVQSLPLGIYNVNISTSNWTKNIKFIKE